MTLDKQIIEMYNQGLGSTTIARSLNISRHSVMYRLKKSGIKLDYRPIIIDEKIIELYKQGISAIELSKMFNISECVIYSNLRRLNVEIKPAGEYRRITVDDNFFNILNNNSCYWAGFIGADGNVYKNTLQINIHKKDELFLEKFRAQIKLSAPIRNNKNNCLLRFRSNEVVNDLKVNFNIIPCKSLILSPPRLENESDIRNYIRGYFDGDGCISKSQNMNMAFFSGSLQLLEWIKTQLKRFLDIGNPNVRPRKNSKCLVLSFGGNKQVKKIMDWLYTDCGENYLDRKYEKYQNFLDKNNWR